MELKAIIFDLDGTLLDTIQDLADSMNAVLQRLGYPTHPIEAHKIFVGDGLEPYVRQSLPAGADDEIVRRGMEMEQQEYGARWADTTRPYDGIPEMLSALDDMGIPKSVLSNKPDAFTQLTVGKLLPDWTFDIVRGVVPDVPKKPDPTGALEIARSFDVVPEEVLFLGDSNTDMLTAIAAGMYPVGAVWGFRTPEELNKNGAKALANHPSDVIKIISSPQ
ncbi:HAD family hydrolase [Planctomycetota bacterium]